MAEFTGVENIKDFAPETFDTIKRLRDEAAFKKVIEYFTEIVFFYMLVFFLTVY